MIVLPGDHVPADALPKPTNQKKALTLGPGLRHIPPNTITSTIAGALVTDNKKNAAWVEYNSGRVSLLLLRWSFKQILQRLHPCFLHSFTYLSHTLFY